MLGGGGGGDVSTGVKCDARAIVFKSALDVNSQRYPPTPSMVSLFVGAIKPSDFQKVGVLDGARGRGGGVWPPAHLGRYKE